MHSRYYGRSVKLCSPRTSIFPPPRGLSSGFFFFFFLFLSLSLSLALSLHSPTFLGSLLLPLFSRAVYLLLLPFASCFDFASQGGSPLYILTLLIREGRSFALYLNVFLRSLCFFFRLFSFPLSAFWVYVA